MIVHAPTEGVEEKGQKRAVRPCVRPLTRIFGGFLRTRANGKGESSDVQGLAGHADESSLWGAID